MTERIGKKAMRYLSVLVFSSALMGCSATGVAPGEPEPVAYSRALDMRNGEALYEAHCHACHTSQAHWRDNSIVETWDDVLEQVERWQRNAGQHWPPTDVADVAAYLNILYYKVPCPAPGCRGDVTAAIDPGPVLASDLYRHVGNVAVVPLAFGEEM